MAAGSSIENAYESIERTSGPSFRLSSRIFAKEVGKPNRIMFIEWEICRELLGKPRLNMYLFALTAFGASERFCEKA